MATRVYYDQTAPMSKRRVPVPANGAAQATNSPR